jgi:hypothetical protein
MPSEASIAAAAGPPTSAGISERRVSARERKTRATESTPMPRAWKAQCDQSTWFSKISGRPVRIEAAR